MIKKVVISVVILNTLYASDFSTSLSNQGYTGVINTPNAKVMQEGDITLHFDNQFDNALRAYNSSAKYSYNENYIVGVGILNYFELQLRLSETPHYHRDLSANFKFQLPYHNKYLPNIAFGYQDLGSAANHYGNRYIVADKEFSLIRTSLGYGDSTVEDSKRARMNGLFWSLEMQTFEWLYLMIEDDSKERFAGIRAELPKRWSQYFKLETRVTKNLNDRKKTSFTLNMTFPLYENRKSYKNATVNQHKQEVREIIKSEKSEQKSLKPKKSIESVTYTLQEMKESLLYLGLEDITIAYRDEEIYVSYENSVFAHNDIDAMGVVVGFISQTDFKKFTLEQKRSQVVVLTLKGDVNSAKEFYKNPNSVTKKVFQKELIKSTPTLLNEYTIAYKNLNSSSLKMKLELSPVVRTFVGNEFGVFNYKLWLRNSFKVNLSQGLDFSIVGDLHINDSKIDDKKYEWFMKLYEKSSHIESVMLHKTFNYLSGMNSVSFGTFEENYVGLLNQYIKTKGEHTFEIKAGYFQKYQDGDRYKEYYLGKYITRDFFIAKYSYMLSEYDLLAELEVGRYWNLDSGFGVKIKRFFGDVAVSMAYTQTKADNLFSETFDKYATIGFEIPLTFQHLPNNKYLQLQGTKAFNYDLKSTIFRNDGSNNLVSGGSYNPPVALSLKEDFYNRGRVQLSYIKSHLFRFVDAYEKYKERR